MSLFEVILTAKRFIHHSSDFLNDLEVLMGYHVREFKNFFFTNDIFEVPLFAISSDRNNWREK